MKNIKLFIAVFLAFTFAFAIYACKDDDDSSTNPIDQLPPETQIGANTFGCLINGEVFTPRGTPFGAPYKVSFYQYVYNSSNDSSYFNFLVAGNDFDKNIGILISLKFENFEDFNETTYTLSQNEQGFGGVGSYNSVNSFDTDLQHTGTITITHYDYENRIVSGTFEFEVEVEGEVYHITEGRFDMNFTI